MVIFNSYDFNTNFSIAFLVRDRRVGGGGGQGGHVPPNIFKIIKCILPPPPSIQSCPLNLKVAPRSLLVHKT